MTILKVTDNSQPLDSRLAFRYFWLNFRLIGMDPPQRYRLPYLIYAITSTFINGIGLPVSLFTNLYFINSADEIVNNLYISVTVLLVTAKQIGIFYFRQSLRQADSYLNQLDQRCKLHAEDRAHILHGIRISHFIYTFYMCSYLICCLGFAFIAITNLTPVCEGWLPRFFEDPDKNTIVMIVHQNICMFSFIFIQNANNDSYPMCYITMMIGHLRALSARIRRIGKMQEQNLDANFNELVACIKDYKNIINFYDCIRPAISTTIFMQFLVTGIVIVLSAIKFTAFYNTMAQKFMTVFYVFLILSEVFPCCCFADMLALENSALTEAIYSCEWYNQNEKFRKMLITFMMRTQRFKLIMAGNLYPVKLRTFIEIMKCSFSMYTILAQLNIK